MPVHSLRHGADRLKTGVQVDAGQVQHLRNTAFRFFFDRRGHVIQRQRGDDHKRNDNSLDVDTVSGATLSSIAFTGAVRQAVEEATGYDPTAGIEMGENEYLGISNNGLGGRLMVKVTVEDGKITAIDVLEAHESEEIGVAALNIQIPKLVESNGEAVDVITGATITCDALNEAVAEAMAASQK